MVTPRRMKKLGSSHGPFGLPPVSIRTPSSAVRISRARRRRFASGAMACIIFSSGRGLRETRVLPNGGLEATFDVSDMGEFKRFVLGFGSDCDVLKPKAFFDNILSDAQAVVICGLDNGRSNSTTAPTSTTKCVLGLGHGRYPRGREDCGKGEFRTGH